MRKDRVLKEIKPYRKKAIPKAVREQVWLRDMGKQFQGKCKTPWCQTIITLFDFQCGHDIPESKGGKTTLENLVPICCRCNTSMGSKYTFTEWSSNHHLSRPWWRKYLCCV